MMSRFAKDTVTASDRRERYGPVKAHLRQYLEMTLEAMEALIPLEEPRRHLWDLVMLYPRRGGKGFRPGLCIGTCRAVGGRVEDALQSAAAIEMLHNAFLVHDDVEDGSEYRRGHLTIHAEHGLGIAVNLGDAMHVLSMRSLTENMLELGPKLTWRILREFEHLVQQSVEGQAMELGWVHDNKCDLSDSDYLRMTLKKTCWYTSIHPCRIGAIIGSGGQMPPSRFNRFGYYMGAAFQIQDDILNLFGDHEKYGKEIGGDIWEGKRTLMLLHAYRSANRREQTRLRTFLSVPRVERTGEDVRWVYRLMKKHDCHEYARTCARNLAGAALREFTTAYGALPESQHKEFLRNIVLYMIDRDL